MNNIIAFKDGTSIEVNPHEDHEYTLSTALVAEGYQVSPVTIRRHLQNNADELVEGKHFYRIQNMNAGNRSELHWTKRGIIRLGFFIKSERAKEFRDKAEDLILGHLESTTYGLSEDEIIQKAFSLMLWKVENQGSALAMVKPRGEFGEISEVSGQPKSQLVPAYYRTPQSKVGVEKGALFHNFTLQLNLDFYGAGLTYGKEAV